MYNKTLSKSFALLILTVLSAFMVAAPPIPSINPSPAYAAATAAEDIPYMSTVLQTNSASANQESNSNNMATGGGIVTNTVEQRLFQGSTNINEDNDVLIGRCIDGHVEINDEDEVTQTNIQSINQESDSENALNDGGIPANEALQESSQVAGNMNIDNDIIIILGCHGGTIELNDNDEVTQTNIQSINQESDSENDEGEDSE
jgi:hypothetical protein